ncbi:NERD domain-containing protein, partial [Escherichia coli]|nr:NERD domain-containing protein [Escherichia coli]
MTSGERRVASRLESFLNDDCFVWYDIPVGRKNRHPDFVIIDPDNGLVFLEVKDWT